MATTDPRRRLNLHSLDTDTQQDTMFVSSAFPWRD